MARINNLSLILATAAFSKAVRAYTEISTSAEIQADTATNVDVSIDTRDEDDSYATGYRIYLATTPPGWGTGPACWLVNDTSLDVTSTKITVPAAVAPDQTVLSLALTEIDIEEGYTYTDGYSYSGDFVLDGGSGSWSAMELNGVSISDPDLTPCSAMQCTRDCADKYYPEGDIEDSLDSVYEDFYNCIAACPGTTYPSWDEIMGDDGDDGDDSSATATGEWSTASSSAAKATKTHSSSVSLASATATTTASSTSSPSSSTSATGSAASTSSSAVTTSAGNRTPALLIPLVATASLAWIAGFFL